MSFRLRVFLLVMLVAVTAIGATAWLTLSLASKQISDAVATSNRNTDVIAEDLGEFAHDRGTWSGVDGVRPEPVEQLRGAHPDGHDQRRGDRRHRPSGR